MITSREDAMTRQIRRAAVCGCFALGLLFWTSTAQAADPALIAAAKKEGQVVWYTTLIVNQLARPITDAFEKKYGIKVLYIRSSEPEIQLRLYNEGRAGRMQADIFDGSGDSTELRSMGLLSKWTPDPAKDFPAESRDPDGYWTAMSLYIGEPGYNTSLTPPAAAPKTFADLLAPKWKNKLAWNSAPTATGAPGFIGAVLKEMGQAKGMAYLHALAKQNVADVTGGARQVFDEVIAGEYPIALQMLTHHAYFSAAHGAPAGWIKLQGAMAFFLVLNLTKGGPDPNAAKLLADFIVSPEGQQIFRQVGYIPANPRIAPLDPSLRPDGAAFRVNYFTPQQIDAAMPKWYAIYKSLFR
jgi:ABC-type Fe3+ transport system substrate-binding protein